MPKVTTPEITATLILPGPVVSVDWLAQHLYQAGLVVFDASLAMPGAQPITSMGDRIGNAIFFDINKISDQSNPAPHMMPSAEQFTEQVQALGVNQDSRIVVYDDKGMFSSARVWWMFKSMGFKHIAVLDGGLPAWQKADYPCYNADVSCEKGDKRCAKETIGNFVANPQEGYFCGAQAVFAGLANQQVEVLDARSPGRFSGEEADPRPGMRSGHMPGAANLHYAKLFYDKGENEGLLKSKAELATLFDRFSPNKNILIFSCGSGVTACILALAATIVGDKNVQVYDGSWSEWGAPGDWPVVFE